MSDLEPEAIKSPRIPEYLRAGIVSLNPGATPLELIESGIQMIAEDVARAEHFTEFLRVIGPGMARIYEARNKLASA